MDIKFTRGFAPYLKDMIAHFPDAKAREFINAGVAVEHKVEKEVETDVKAKMVRK